MIYQAKIYTGIADGGVTDFAGVVIVCAENSGAAYDKAMAHWCDLIKNSANVYIIIVNLLEAEVIIT